MFQIAIHQVSNHNQGTNESASRREEERELDIQKAKDLIWLFMDANDKRMALHVATTNQLAEMGKQIKHIGLVYSYTTL